MPNLWLERVSGQNESDDEDAAKDTGQSESPDASGVSKLHELSGDEKPFCGGDSQDRYRNRPLFAKDKPEAGQRDQKNPGDEVATGHSR